MPSIYCVTYVNINNLNIEKLIRTTTYNQNDNDIGMSPDPPQNARVYHRDEVKEEKN